MTMTCQYILISVVSKVCKIPAVQKKMPFQLNSDNYCIRAVFDYFRNLEVFGHGMLLERTCSVYIPAIAMITTIVICIMVVTCCYYFAVAEICYNVFKMVVMDRPHITDPRIFKYICSTCCIYI